MSKETQTELESQLQNYIDFRIQEDPDFAREYAKREERKRTLKGCIEFIEAEVYDKYKSQCCFVDNNEVYNLLVHYFMEEQITPKKLPTNIGVATSKSNMLREEAKNVVLTDEEKEKARQMAIDRMADDFRKEMQGRTQKKAEKPTIEQPTLF